MADSIYDLIATIKFQYENEGAKEAANDLNKIDQGAAKVTGTLGAVGNTAEKSAQKTSSAFKEVGNEIRATQNKITKGPTVTGDPMKGYTDAVKKSLLSLDAVYEINNQKLADKDKKFSIFRAELQRQGLGLSEREIKTYYENVLGITEKYNQEIAKADQGNLSTKQRAIEQLKVGVTQRVSQITGIDPGTIGEIGSKLTGGAVGATALAAGIALATVKLAEFAEEEDKAITNFASIIGSVRLSETLVDELDTLATQTKFTGDELQDAAFTLLKFGVAAEDVPDKIKSLGDVAAATGVSLGTLADITGRIDFRGFANPRELKVLEQQGIPIFESLAAVTGKTVQELRKLKKVSDTDVKAAFAQLSADGGKFAGVLEQQSQSLTSYRKRLSDAFTNIKESIGQAFLPAAKVIYSNLIPALNKVTEILTPLVKVVGVSLKNAFEITFGAISTGWNLISSIVGNFAGFVNDVTKLFGLDFSKIDFSALFTEFLATINAISNVIDDFFKNVGTGGKIVFKEIVRVFETALGKVFQNIPGLQSVGNKLLGLAFVKQNEINELQKQKIDLQKEFNKEYQKYLDMTQKENAQKLEEEEIDNDALARQAKFREERAKALQEVKQITAELRKQYEDVQLDGLFDPKKIIDQRDVINTQRALIDQAQKIANAVNTATQLSKKYKIQIPFTVDVDSFFLQNEIQKGLETLPDALVIPEIPILMSGAVSLDVNLDRQKTLAMLEKEISFFKDLPDAVKNKTVDILVSLGVNITPESAEKAKAELDKIIKDVTALTDPTQSVELAKAIQEGLSEGISEGEIARVLSEKFNFSEKQIAALIKQFKENAEGYFKEEDSFLKKAFDGIFGFKKDGTSFLGKAEEALLKDALNSAATQISAFTDTYIQGELDKTDFLISQTESRIDKLKEIADQGNSEQLQIEEDRLAELTKRREAFAQKQKQIAAVEVATSQAVAAAKSIQGLTSAFAAGGPAGIATGIAYSVALAASIASIIAGVSNAFGSIPGYKTGTEYIQGPGTETSDSVLVRTSKGERIVDAPNNRKIGETKNKDLPRLVEKGKEVERLVKNSDYREIIKTGLKERFSNSEKSNNSEKFGNSEKLTNNVLTNMDKSKIDKSEKVQVSKETRSDYVRIELGGQSMLIREDKLRTALSNTETIKEKVENTRELVRANMTHFKTDFATTKTEKIRESLVPILTPERSTLLRVIPSDTETRQREDVNIKLETLGNKIESGLKEMGKRIADIQVMVDFNEDGMIATQRRREKDRIRTQNIKL
ncbi:MAG: hypothetical protein IPP06_17895 [Saprospiraceae bacterium]|nr:hypothetical protein [Candidatus Vicinibacter affinis]